MEKVIPMVRLTRMAPQLLWLVWLVSVGCSDDPIEQTSPKMTPMMPMAGTPPLSRPGTQPSSAGQPSDSNQGGSTTPSSPPPFMPPATGGSVQTEPSTAPEALAVLHLLDAAVLEDRYEFSELRLGHIFPFRSTGFMKPGGGGAAGSRCFTQVSEGATAH